MPSSRLQLPVVVQWSVRFPDSNETGSPAEIEGEVPYAEVVCDHVAYDDWGMEPCRSWDEVSYVWRRVFMSRADLIERFGNKIGKEVPLDWTPLYDTSNDSEKAEKVKRAAVYEIWSKDDRKVYWVNRSYPKGCLDVRDDWLGLKGFFPCPRPLTGTLAPDSYIPVPDFVYYEDQANELDKVVAVFTVEEAGRGTLTPKAMFPSRRPSTRSAA